MRIKYSLLHIVIVVATLLWVVSCAKDDLNGNGEQGKAQISVVARNVNDDAANLDERIASLRMMVFSGSGGSAVIEYNILENLSIGTSQFVHTINTGTRTIVFVANETPDVTTQLRAVTRINDLYNVNFSSNAFDGASYVPMYASYDDVTITKDPATGNAVISGGGTMINNTWKIELEKLAIKLDITLTSEDDKTAVFGGVTLGNLPSYVPLMPAVMYDNNSALGDNVTIPSSDFTITYSAPSGWQAKSNSTTRIILPSKVFTSVNQDTDKSHAVVLTANMTSGNSPSGAIGFAMPVNYSLPRNNNYIVTAKVQSPMPVNVDVMAWNTDTLNNIMGRTLQLSAITFDVTERTRARVTFTSNQRYVYVDPSSPNINDFDGISGTGGSNVHYQYDSDLGFGSGYIDLHSSTLTATLAARLIITANGTGSGVGLSRQITVNFKKTDSATNTYDDFVGAFWQANQVGERIIYYPGPVTNSWQAEVEDPTGTGSFVVLSSSFSYDPNIFTDSAADAEQFPVSDGVKTVTGTGRIYFRIGLTGIYPIGALQNGTPRYARVKITPNIQQPGTVKYIYVRQGEAADYLMRPNEPTTTLSRRDFAIRFSPYNLTSSVMSIGGASVTNHPSVDVRGASFTKYPSQAGALLSWINSTANNIRKAFHPLNTSTTLASWAFANAPVGSASISGFPQYWGSSYDYETCPPGYRRPENGEIFNPATTSNPASSEILQSLWLNPTAVGNTTNSIYGYLADGFFDRRLPTVSINNTEISAVSATTKDVAYVGRLFYNPATNASLFFPLSGSRANASSGALSGVGSIGSYWTASASTTNNAWNFQLTNSSATPIDITTRGSASNIRCVADNGLKIISFSDNSVNFGQAGILAETQMFVTDRFVNFGPHGTYNSIDNVRYYYSLNYNGYVYYPQIANFEGLLIVAYSSFINLSDAEIDRIADRIISGKLALIYQTDGPSSDPFLGADVRIMARLLGKNSATYSQIFNPTNTFLNFNTFSITANPQDHPIMNGPFGGVPYGSTVYQSTLGEYPVSMAVGVNESQYPDMVVLARRSLADVKDNIMIAVHKKYPFMLMRNGTTLGENEYAGTNKQLLRPLWLNFAVWSFEYKKSMGM